MQLREDLGSAEAIGFEVCYILVRQPGRRTFERQRVTIRYEPMAYDVKRYKSTESKLRDMTGLQIITRIVRSSALFPNESSKMLFSLYSARFDIGEAVPFRGGSQSEVRAAYGNSQRWLSAW